MKVAADWIDRDLGDLAPVWPDGSLKEAIGRAHDLGARVAAHVFGEDALPGLIAAGIDSIEHGTGLTADLLDDVARRGIAVVPTLINTDNFPSFAAQGEAKYPAYAAHMRALYATARERLRATWDAGIPVYTGTDAGGSLAHGLVRDEMRALVAAGIPQADVVAQASCRVSTSARRPTWSSMTPIRAPICPLWTVRGGWCCAAWSSPDRSAHDSRRGELARRQIAGVHRGRRLDHHDVALVVGARAMLDALRDDVQLSRAELYVAVAQLQGEVAADDEEHLVGLRVRVPDELAVDPGQPDVVVVERRDRERAPVLTDACQCGGQINRGSHLATLSPRPCGTRSNSPRPGP